MSTIHDRVSKTIIKNLLLIIFIFYAFQYAVCMVIAAAAGGIWSDDASTPGLRADYSAALLPFWHYNCGLGEGSVALASWLTLVLSQLLLIGLIFFIVRSTNYAWDYAVTVSFVHFILTCLCTLAFPTNWSWWVTLIVSTVVVVLSSTYVTYRLHDLRDIEK